MKTTLTLRELGVEFLHALVISGLAVGQIRQAFAMDDRPVVMLFHAADVVAATRRHFGAQRKQHGRLVALAERSFPACSRTRRSRHRPLLGTSRVTWREDVIRLVAQERLAVGLQLVRGWPSSLRR